MLSAPFRLAAWGSRGITGQAIDQNGGAWVG